MADTARTAPADCTLTRVVAGNMSALDDAEILVEENRSCSGGLLEARETGQGQYETFADVLALGDTFSVRPGGHAPMRDFWTEGRQDHPILSTRFKALQKATWPHDQSRGGRGAFLTQAFEEGPLKAGA